MITERKSAVYLRVDAGHGDHAGGDPASRRHRRPGGRGPAGAIRHRYALLRPGDGGGVLRLGQLSGLLEERRTQRMIDSYTDHFIICGFGRVGRQVARDLLRAGVEHVTIDRSRATARRRRRWACATSRATPPTTRSCSAPGIERARAVIACVDSDADNIFIALTARELRPDILIVARASAEDSEKKLLRAGADRVISPYKTSGTEMARVALHPQVGGAVQVADYRLGGDRRAGSCEGVGQDGGGGARRVGDRRRPAHRRPAGAPARPNRRSKPATCWWRSARPALERLESRFSR